MASLHVARDYQPNEPVTFTVEVVADDVRALQTTYKIGIKGDS